MKLDLEGKVVIVTGGSKAAATAAGGVFASVGCALCASFRALSILDSLGEVLPSRMPAVWQPHSASTKADITRCFIA